MPPAPGGGRAAGPVSIEFRMIGDFDLSEQKVAEEFTKVVKNGVTNIGKDARGNAPKVSPNRKYPPQVRVGKPKPGELKNSIKVRDFVTTQEGQGRLTRAGNRVYTLQIGIDGPAARFAPWVIFGTGEFHGKYRNFNPIITGGRPWKIPGAHKVTYKNRVVTIYEGTSWTLGQLLDKQEAGNLDDVALEVDKTIKVLDFKPLAIHNQKKYSQGRLYKPGGEDIGELELRPGEGKPYRKFKNVLFVRPKGRLTIPGQKPNPFLHKAAQRGRETMRQQIREFLAKVTKREVEDIQFRMYIRIR